MSNSVAQHYYDEIDREIERNKEYLNALADEVRQTPPSGPAFDDRQWLEKNKEKILRTRRLIDLLK